LEIISANGIDLAYTRRGQGAPLVLLHGFPLDHTIWREVVPYLETDFDLILPDLRGFGRSAAGGLAFTISDMADDIASLLDNIGIEKTLLAGHSMGGYVALAFAKKYPQRVSGLGLVSSQAAADTPKRREGRYKTAAEVAEKGVSVVVEAMLSKLSADLRVQNFAREVMEGQNQSALVGALKAMAEREDAASFLSSINFPLLLIHGGVDVLIPIERAREIKAAVPPAQMIELKGAGHMPMMELAKETAEALKTFSVQR
jgi:pimeloyl-ACP methyl ester carboxylesterase